jgi:hypothetical protein
VESPCHHGFRRPPTTRDRNSSQSGIDRSEEQGEFDRFLSDDGGEGKGRDGDRCRHSRRRLQVGLVDLYFRGNMRLSPHSQTLALTPGSLRQMHPIALNVCDMNASRHFYSRVYPQAIASCLGGHSLCDRCKQLKDKYQRTSFVIRSNTIVPIWKRRYDKPISGLCSWCSPIVFSAKQQRRFWRFANRGLQRPQLTPLPLTGALR